MSEVTGFAKSKDPVSSFISMLKGLSDLNLIFNLAYPYRVVVAHRDTTLLCTVRLKEQLQCSVR